MNDAVSANSVSLHIDNVHNDNNEFEMKKGLHFKAFIFFFMNADSAKQISRPRYVTFGDLMIPFVLLLVKHVNDIKAYSPLVTWSPKS